MFQSDTFQLHRLVSEIECVTKMFCFNFTKKDRNEKISTIDVDMRRFLP